MDSALHIGGVLLEPRGDTTGGTAEERIRVRFEESQVLEGEWVYMIDL